MTRHPRLFPVDRAEALAELHRELAMRQGLYPGWIREGKLSEHRAQQQLEGLEAAIDFLVTDAEGDPDVAEVAAAVDLDPPEGVSADAVATLTEAARLLRLGAEALEDLDTVHGATERAEDSAAMRACADQLEAGTLAAHLPEVSR